VDLSADSLLPDPSAGTDLKIKIIGVGGAGSNVVDGLNLNDFGGVELAVMNTDVQALTNSKVTEKLVIGRSITRGLGAGGEVEIGKQAAESDRAAITTMIGDSDLLILVVGLGGGTGSPAAAVVAELAAKTQALVLVFATMPFSFEGARRAKIAEDSIGELRQLAHGLITLPNDVLLQEGEEDTTVVNAFAVADKWISRGVNSLCAMLLKTGLINQDLGALRSVFHDYGGKTIFGTGMASGSDYVLQALDDLFMCPLMHQGDRPKQLDRILVNVIGGVDLGIAKLNEIMAQVSKRIGSRDDIVFGAVIDETRRESLEICILAKTSMGLGATAGAAMQKTADVVKHVLEGGLGLETEISRDDTPQRPVHRSKLRSKKENATDQDEFMFIDTDAQRGYFDKTDRNEYNGEDLDVPTFLRRGIKIKIK